MLHQPVITPFRPRFPWERPLITGGNSAAVLDLFSGGTLTRASEASYLTGAPTDGSTAFLAWAAANTRRIENRGDGLGDMLLLEGSRTNIQIHSRDMSAAGWSAGTATQTYDQAAGPDGAVLADRVNATSGQFSSNRTVAGSGAYVATNYSRAVSGTADLRILINDPGQTVRYAAVGTSYQRLEAVAPTVASAVGYIPLDGRAFDVHLATAFDAYTDLHQVEAGYWPSSVIRNATSGTVTRASEQLDYTVGNYPSSFLTTGFSFTYVPDHSSTETAAATHTSRFAGVASGTNILQMFFNGSIGLYINGILVVQSGATTFSRGQPLTISCSPINGRITLSGFTTGNGTWAGTGGAWPSATFNVGMSSVSPYGRLSRYYTGL